MKRGSGGESGGPLIQGVVDGPQKRESRSAAFAFEVVGVDGPGHDSGQVVVGGKLGLVPDGLFVVVADPLELLDHVRHLLVAVPLLDPGLVDLRELLADLVVAEESVLSGVGPLRRESN